MFTGNFLRQNPVAREASTPEELFLRFALILGLGSFSLTMRSCATLSACFDTYRQC